MLIKAIFSLVKQEKMAFLFEITWIFSFNLLFTAAQAA